MKEIKAEGVDLFLSNGAYRELQERFHEYHEDTDVNGEIASYLGDKVDDLFRENENFQKYIEIYSQISQLNGFAMLESESDYLASLDEWYRDGKRIKRVQRWIDEQDGKYACLFLCVSGISEKLVESFKSLLFIPDRGVSDTVFSLFSPLHGLIDMYTVDYYLKEIEELSSLPLDEIKAAIGERRHKEWLQMSGLEDEDENLRLRLEDDDSSIGLI